MQILQVRILNHEELERDITSVSIRIYESKT
jgi:hypothetical protein